MVNSVLIIAKMLRLYSVDHGLWVNINIEYVTHSHA